MPFVDDIARTQPFRGSDDEAEKTALRMERARRRGDEQPDLVGAGAQAFDAQHAARATELRVHLDQREVELQRLQAEERKAQAVYDRAAKSMPDPTATKRSLPEKDLVGAMVEMSLWVLTACLALSLFTAVTSILVMDGIVSTWAAAVTLSLPLTAGGLLGKLVVSTLQESFLSLAAKRNVRLFLFGITSVAFSIWAWNLSSMFGDAIFASLSGDETDVGNYLGLDGDAEAPETSLPGRVLLFTSIACEGLLAASFFVGVTAMCDARSDPSVVEPKATSAARKRLEVIGTDVREAVDHVAALRGWLTQHEANRTDFAQRVRAAWLRNHG